MEDGVFTYEVEIAEVTNISCDLKKEDGLEQQISHESDDDMEYDPSDVEFTKWLASKKILTTRHGSLYLTLTKELWIYWARGDDEVELTDEESSNSNDEDKVTKDIGIRLMNLDFRDTLVDDKEYVAIKENECDDLTNASEEAIHTYQEIFRMMDEGWMVTRTK
ncbi:hypothetical protein Tco_1482684 [Tanacetum coccineum]